MCLDPSLQAGSAGEPPMLPAKHAFAFHQRGLGLPMAIFIIVIVGAVLLALTDLNRSGTQGTVQGYESQRAFYAAESGVQIGLNRVLMGGAACGDFNLAFSAKGMVGCAVDVACSQLDVAGLDYYTFNSTGTCGSGVETGRRQIEVRVRSE